MAHGREKPFDMNAKAMLRTVYGRISRRTFKKQNYLKITAMKSTYVK